MTPSDISPSSIRAARDALENRIIRTPMLPLRQQPFAHQIGDGISAWIKLELFQHAGSFKARGNLLGIERLSRDQRASGVIAASGGNHALAVAWAAAQNKVHAKLIMPRATDPLRVDGCKSMGAEVVLVDDIAAAFDVMNRDAEADGLTVMHPFEGEHMTLGAATLGAEIVEDLPDIDCMVVAVGGGGLIGGVAAAIAQEKPDCEIIGVEPFGADSLSQSFEQGEPVRIGTVDTIADSLGSPTALPYSFAVARRYVSRIVRIEDKSMLEAMALLRDGLKIIAEPACAASLAAIMGPLRDSLLGRNVGILACGSNIGQQRFSALLGED
ncbi:threonine ammonia-lyase [Hoeflea prorocentri]|uniref:Pyridoxal-phosphate dependent enzyme n=1 Tax=Hoeflea prorocentri TaxID=1922333 RepID=A0A9X3UHZ1_9HYPH|nr:pyridoxal-phosphate dependent enzyme [Hoeflea prorocentri]MCY6381160.1 pyridoxal-phosphate dependent enzyme [Hoeflea prorocentri]MDA5398960.1 pyridoxal-phosphate dependent enzyme [Hoeflea prorocentri]